VIDRQFILQRSSAGQEMLAQAQGLSKTAETQFKAEENQLATEAGQLQQQLAIMAPDVRDQKEKDFTTKQQAFQARVAQRQAEIQAGFNKAARQVEIALEPILKSLMTERGANMVFDRSSVILSTVDVDVTPVAVQRLDKALPHVKVELTAVPPGAAAAAGPAIGPRPAGTPGIGPAGGAPAPIRK
jgi:Skp family chaperone for outer membrane proteins